MNCPNCGKELNPGDKFCIACGTKIESSTAGDQIGAGNRAGTLDNESIAGAAERANLMDSNRPETNIREAINHSIQDISNGKMVNIKRVSEEIQCFFCCSVESCEYQ